MKEKSTDKFNFKSQPATSIEQSERLLALGLKKETRDAVLKKYIHNDKYCYKPIFENIDDRLIDCDDFYPAWSLGRLVEIIKNCDFKTIESEVWRKELKIFTLHLLIRSSDDLFENAISVIEVLIHKGYFNKEYLV